MTKLIRPLVLLVLLCLSATAFADEAEDTYNRGMTHFNAKEFAKARVEYMKAYALRQEPTILFAIAQTYRFEGNYKEAIDWYKKFLADSAAAQNLRSEAQTYLDESEKAQKAVDDARRRAAEGGPKEPNGKPATAGTLIGGGTITAPASPAGQSDVVRKRRIPTGSKIAAAITGAGLISALVFTKLGLDAEKDLEENPMAGPADANRVERYQNLINLSWGITGAAAITAVIIYFAAPSYSTDRRNVVIAPTRDGGWQAVFRARF